MGFLASLSAHLPELSLLLGGVLLLVWRRLFTGAKAWEGFFSALSCLAVVAAFLALRLLGSESLGLATAESASTFQGWMRADQYSNLYQLMLVVATGVALLLAPRRLGGPSDTWLLHPQSILLIGAGAGCLALSSAHLLLMVFFLEATNRSLGFFVMNLSGGADEQNLKASASTSKSQLSSSIILLIGVFLLAAQGNGFSYLAASIGVTQAWGQESTTWVMLAWLLLSIGIFLKARDAMKSLKPMLFFHTGNASATTKPPIHRNFGAAAALLAVAIPVVLFGVWLRLSTAIFAGLVESSNLAGGDGTLAIIQNLILLAAAASMIAGLLATRKARQPMAILLATGSIHLGLLLTCASGLNQDAAIISSMFATSLVLGFLGAIAGLQALTAFRPVPASANLTGVGLRRPWLGMTVAVVFISLVGLPPTGGLIARWGLVTEMMASQQISLLILCALASVGLIAAYFPILRQVFQAGSAQTEFTRTDIKQVRPSTNEDGSGRPSARSAFWVTLTCAIMVICLFEPTELLRILQNVGRDIAFW